MSIGTTNIHLDDDGSNGGIYSDVNNGGTGGSQVKFSDMVTQDWSRGQPPGDGTNSYWAYGLKTGSDNPLYNPMNLAGGSQISSNFKFSFFKNSYAYMDQSTYVIDLYLENQIPPAPRTDPPNHVDADFALYDNTLTSDAIATIGGTAIQGGGTYGPVDQSASFTFNVEYFYVDGAVNCQGLNPYTFDMQVNGSTVLFVGGAGPGSYPFDYNNFSSLPTNSGSGFDIEIYFTP
jgi:hypothetical protein